MKNENAGFFEPAYDDHAYNVYFTIAWELAEYAHFHSRFELIYILDGEAEAVVNGKSCIRKTGDLVVVNPFEPHYYRKKSDVIRAYVVSIDELYLSDLYRVYGKKQFDYDPKKIAGESGERIRFYLDRWMNDSGIKDVMANQGWINLVTAELVKIYGLRAPSELRLNSTQMLGYIQAHYSEDITMEKVAKKMGYSKEYFSCIFNKLVGMNFRSYLNKLRLEKARILLKDRSKRVTDVIAEVGFANSVMYYRAVKKFGKDTETERRPFKRGKKTKKGGKPSV